LILIIKETKTPIICVCNDRQSPKVKSLANHCYDIEFKKPTKKDIVKQSISSNQGVYNLENQPELDWGKLKSLTKKTQTFKI